MRIRRELKIFLFAILFLSKRKSSVFIFIILSFLIFVIASATFISESIKKELIITHTELPDIVVQKIVGGRQQYLPVSYIDDVLDIPGISRIYPRIWGYYYFDYAGVNFSIVGIDPFEPQYKKSLEDAIADFDINKLLSTNNWIIVGYGIHTLFNEIAYINEAYFKKPDGQYLAVTPIGVLGKDGSILNGDIVLMSKDYAKELLGLKDNEVTDFAVDVYNKNEIVTIAAKIRDRLKDVRTVTKEDVLNSYNSVFNYKSGIFLSLFGVLIFTMIIIVIDKLSGISESERLEIGVLKSTGWSTGDILKLKFYESSFLALFSYIFAVLAAMIYVFLLKAPVMIDIFRGYGALKLDYHLIFAVNFYTLSLIFFTTIPFYISAVIIPTYKLSTIDTYEVFR